jgi:hypothetical protein
VASGTQAVVHNSDGILRPNQNARLFVLFVQA